MNRRELEARPLLALAFALTLGLCLPVTPWAPLLTLFIPVVYRNWRVWAASLALLGVGAVLSPKPVQQLEHPYTLQGEPARILRMPTHSADGERLTLGTRHAVFQAFLPFSSGMAWGDEVRVTGLAVPVEKRPSPFLSGELHYPFELEMIANGPAVGRAGIHLRRSFIAFTHRTLPERQAALLDGICFNATADLDYDSRQALARSGLIHILSASGMHVVLLAGALAWLARMLPMPRWLQVAFVLILLMLYGFAAGFQAPIFRAIVMAGGALVAYLLERESDNLSLVALGALLTLLVMPRSIHEVGFVLSFAATLGIVLFGPPLLSPPKEFWKRRWFEAKTSLWVGASATLGVGPVLLAIFGSMSLIGPVAGLLAAPALPPIMLLSLGFWGLDALGLPHVNELMQGLVAPLLHYVMLVAQVTSSLPFAAISDFHVPMPLSLLALGGMLLLWRVKPRPSGFDS